MTMVPGSVRQPRQGRKRDNADPVWTKNRLKQLEHLRSRGYDARSIASAIGVSVCAVHMAAHYHALPKLASGRPRK